MAAYSEDLEDGGRHGGVSESYLRGQPRIRVKESIDELRQVRMAGCDWPRNLLREGTDCLGRRYERRSWTVTSGVAFSERGGIPYR